MLRVHPRTLLNRQLGSHPLSRPKRKAMKNGEGAIISVLASNAFLMIPSIRCRGQDEITNDNLTALSPVEGLIHATRNQPSLHKKEQSKQLFRICPKLSGIYNIPGPIRLAPGLAAQY
ncbi:hypothetical protein WG66_008885 [Moniliophthora roreri]|nr:hypothetical protein WG66_008885 [Moniliophthora roreri]